MCKGLSDLNGSNNGVCVLNGDSVTVGDAGGRCGTCTIGFDILSSRDCFTVLISCL